MKKIAGHIALLLAALRLVAVGQTPGTVEATKDTFHGSVYSPTPMSKVAVNSNNVSAGIYGVSESNTSQGFFAYSSYLVNIQPSWTSELVSSVVSLHYDDAVRTTPHLFGDNFGAKPEGLLFQPDGKLIFAGCTETALAVCRITTTDQPDTTFGTVAGTYPGLSPLMSGRFAVIPLAYGCYLKDMALQADGKILFQVASPASQRIVRLTTSGVLDTTFGGTGTVVVPGLEGPQAPGAIEVLPSGKILVSFALGELTKSGVVARLNADGTLDATYGVGGVATVPTVSLASIQDMETDFGGKTALVGAEAGTNLTTVVKLLPTGAVDTSFSGDGIAVYAEKPGPVALKSRADGRLFVLYSRGWIMRLRPDGGLDAGFGTAGIAGSGVFAGSSMAMRPDGKLVVGGWYGTQSNYSRRMTLVTAGPLVIDTAPSIATHPTSLTVNAGSTASFSVAMSSPLDTNFVWRRNGSVITGANASTLTIANAGLANEGNYTVEITNLIGGVTSNAARLTVVAPPVVTVPPTSYTAPIRGGTRTLTVTTTGRSPFTYQWQKDTVDIGIASSSPDLVIDLQPSAAGSYRVKVVNTDGQVTSAAATISVVTQPPQITTHPASGSGLAGGTHRFEVAVTGRTPLTYQWQKDEVDFGAPVSTSSLSDHLDVVRDAANDGSYRVIVSNIDGTITSNAAALTSQPNPPVIVTEPEGGSAIVGAAALTASVAVTGRPPFTFRWFKGTTPVNFEQTDTTTSSQLSIPTLEANTGDYHCVVTNVHGSDTSRDASFEFGQNNSLHLSPAAILLAEGQTLSLSTQPFFADSPLIIEWRRDNAVLPEEQSGEVQRFAAAVADGGSYRCVYGRIFGPVVSNEANVVVVEKVARTQAAAAGKPVTILARHSGKATGYQWSKDDHLLIGQTSRGLTISSPTAAQDEGIYECAVTLDGQSVTTGGVTLTVESEVPVLETTPPPAAAVGRPYRYDVDASHTPDSFKITGLPPGLSYSTSTGEISGVPLTPGTFKLQITATNPVGTSAVATRSFVVDKADSNVIGAWKGLAGEAGTVSLTVAANATFTGKLILKSTAGKLLSIPLRGRLQQNDTGRLAGSSQRFTVPSGYEGYNSGQPATFDIEVAENEIDSTTGQIGGGSPLGFAMYHNPWNATTHPAEAYKGYHTCSLSPTGLAIGNGYAPLTIAANGTLTLVCTLPSGTPVTCSTFVDGSGRCWVHSWLYSNKGSLYGEISLVAGTAPAYYDTTITGALTWNKPSHPLADTWLSGAPLYAGVNATINIVGARYLPPNVPLVTGPIVMNASQTPDNMDLSLSVNVMDVPYQGDATGTVNAAGKVSLPPPESDPTVRYTSLSFNPNTGRFSGSATYQVLDGDGKVVERIPITYKGLVYRTSGTTNTAEGSGYFVVSYPTPFYTYFEDPETQAQIEKLAKIVTIPYGGIVRVAAK